MAVYILCDSGNNRLKIGYSRNIKDRLKTHATSNPDLEVLALIEQGDRRTEKALHRLAKGHRVSGTTEWYIDSPKLRQVLLRVSEQLNC